MGEIRLGDIIDDFCVKCKRIMNHAVVSMLNGEPAKVRCRTCHNDHDYRHEQPPPPKADTRKQALFAQVLAKVAPGGAAGPVAPEPLLEDPTDGVLSEEEPAGEVSAEEALPEEVLRREKAKPKKAKAMPKPAPKTTPKAKAKPKAKGRK